ncbi:TolC family protein [Flavobacterium beibuense]|uniref:Outer membrane protein-like protein n=1 Tax=Flavobacterium beibuense TaxID=657326 RepID=A0A444WGC0_9FLAO|nr:TolC family protein [Flavobacterium beibuense]RYJ44890.1 Outer membrane protein-like protein [Flavobacterium beibuense]
MKPFLFLVFIVLMPFGAFSQEFDKDILSFSEYLGYVKKYHPMVSRANLEIDKAQAQLMQARGGFDPKIEVDFDKKQFKDTEYYSILNSSFKIPTWYGIELKAAFDNSEGVYLNPQNSTPNQGLTSVGITVPVGQGLFINQRMADLRNAKLQINLSQAQQRLSALDVLYNASEAYFSWLKHYNEVQMYKEYLDYAEERYEGVLKLIEQGDKPAIDSVETGISLKNRKLSLENATLKLNKARLEMANYLWINGTPVEPAEDLKPEVELIEQIETILNTGEINNTEAIITTHPKLKMLETKIEMLDIERKLKANYLLPKIDLGYYYLSEPSYFDNFRTEDYKIGLNFSFPIFLRKERGALNLTKLKLQDTKFELQQEQLQIKNKIDAQLTEIASLKRQVNLLESLVKDYQTMLEAEDRLFSFGESSIFIINSRETNLIAARIQQINMENSLLMSNAGLFKIMAVSQ